MNLPDRIIAIGGAGKALAYELLEADWVIESILEPRPNPRSLTVTVIDTAEEERNRDLERINEIREDIRETKDEFRSGMRGRPGEINIEYLPITENIQLHDRNDLIGDSVERIATGNGMDPNDWWLRARHINENLNFATGVVRKRGLGKAIYYKAYAEDDTVSTSIDLPNKGTVAVLAGLGGGTGSGVVLDLVRDLKQTKRTAEITLFGILPNDEEPNQENANAHAALSEMEYMSLTQQNVFKDRVLIPIDPTGFGGKTGNMIQSSEPLEEFDRAAIYLIVSYYNMMDMEDPFADTPSYAPFVVGIPQVLRYNVDAIKEAKGSVQEILNRKQDALEAEEAVYSDLDRFLSKHYGVDMADDVEFNDSDISNLEERLTSIEQLLEFDLFNELDYHSVSTYREIINDAERESEDITEQLDIIESALVAGTADTHVDGEQFVDTTDQQLKNVIEEELTQLAFRKRILKRIQAVEDSRVHSALSFLVGQEDDAVNTGVRLNRLNSQSEEAAERKEQLQSDLEEVEAELREKSEEQSSQLQRKLSDWETRARREFEEYQDAREVDVGRLTSDLERSLESFAEEVDRCVQPQDLDTVSDADVRQALEELETQLSTLDTDVGDQKQDITEGLNDLVEAKRSFLKMTQDDSGLLGKLGLGGDDKEKAQKNYTAKKTRLSNSNVFSISNVGEDLKVEVEFNPTRIVDDAEADIERSRRRVVRTLRDELDGEPDSGVVDRFEQELERGADFRRLRSIAEEAFEAELSGTDEIQSRKEDLEAELEEVTQQVELYEATVDLFKNVNNRRDTFVEQQREYRSMRSSYSDQSARTVSTEDDDYLYVKPTRPKDILKVQDDSDIAESRLFDEQKEAGQQERYRLRGHLEELAKRSHDPSYNGLQKRRLSSDRSRYQHTTVVAGVVSRAVDQIAELADLEDVFQGAYNTSSAGDSSGFASFAVPTGGSWDVGLGMFVGGVFLDNLRKESEGSGYYKGYKQIHQSDDTDIRIHHTLGLDKGFYVRRTNLKNMENPRDVRFFLQDDSDIRDGLLNDHLEKVQLGDDGSDSTQSTSEIQGTRYDE